ncbi:MAG TPA: L-histidine N(alpha)-methyltransferase [Burkholderiaceae bacterium]|nr:L-histidine N(alpha)-methyltransferase [Burkholderiaceae bacterium]
MTPLRTPRFIQFHVTDAAAERADIEAGLLAEPARAAPKFFYDRLGSHLFEAITELPEYYPTRTEAAIFAAHGAAIASRIGAGATLIDLGAGNCAKASKLFPLLEPKRYVAVDISVDFLHDALKRVQREHPALDVVGLGQDFSAALALPDDLIDGRAVFFYPGSSIGNFAAGDALAFLRRIRAQADGGGLLIGVDLVKDSATLQAAYDDALGVTAAFNLNLLRQLNRLIGSDFRPEDWRHIGLYNEAESRIEMHLEARRDLLVRWPGAQRAFRVGERLHTENSCKYTLERFSALLRDAGFAPPVHWTDGRGWFGVFWAPAS